MSIAALRLAAGAVMLLASMVVPVLVCRSGPALAQSTTVAEKEAFEAAKSLGTVEAWDAFLSSYSSGFYADLARAYVKKLAAPAPAAVPPPSQSAASAGAESVTRSATAIRVGKWPERAAFDGRSLWVSESGARSIVQIDIDKRRVGKRHKVGRLPVDMVATENGTVYALSETDNMIYALASGGDDDAGEFASVPRCADVMAYADNTLWVVSNLNCSAPAVLTRVSHLNGRTAKVADLLGGPVDMKAAHGFVYVAHMTVGARAAFLSIVEAKSGNAAASPDLPVHYPRLAANRSAVFVGGAPPDQNTGVVVKVAAGKAAFAAERRLPEAVVAMGAVDQLVVAVGRQGTIFVLSASDLSLVRTIRTDASIQARDVVATGNTLAVVSSAGNEVASDNVVYPIDGWMPGTAAGAPAFVAPAEAPPRPKPVAEKPSPPPLKCGTNYKKVNGQCVLLQNCGDNAYRSPEGDCSCDKGFEMRNGKCVPRQKAQPAGDNCPGDSVLKNGKCVKEAEPEFKPPIKCTGGQLYSLSQQRCVCQDGLKWNGQRCYLP